MLNEAQYLQTAVNTQVCIGKQFDYLILVVLKCQKRHKISVFIPHSFTILFICDIPNTRVGTVIVATIYLQLKQNRYMFRSFTVLQCSHQHCVQPVSSDVEVVGYL